MPARARLADFLFDQLHAEGVRQVFGIPGDFAIGLCNALERHNQLQLVTLCHEPAVGFAADGCARITNNLGACLVTYGAGGLNTVNAVACAYAEQSPVVVLSGSPGRGERRSGILVHHEVKNFDSQLRVFQEITAYAAVLDDPSTAGRHIRRALRTARAHARPVYLEVPRDLVDAWIDVPLADDEKLFADEEAAAEAADEIRARLAASRRPVLIVGIEVHRFRLQRQVVELAERLGLPVCSSFLGTAIFPEDHPQYVGTYLGTVSPPATRAVVEQSDCVLLLGERISDTGLGISSAFLRPGNLIVCASRGVFIRHHRYEGTPLDRLLAHLLERAEPAAQAVCWHGAGRYLSAEALDPGHDDEPLRIRHLIGSLNGFLAEHPDVPIVADTGDALFASVDLHSRRTLAPAYYATMGFAVPAALGLQSASGERPVVLVGDGAFQMTGQEICQCPRLGLDPVVIVLKNQCWQVIQAFVPEGRYNEVVDWPFARLAELWGGRGFTARTPGQFRQALADAWAGAGFALIEAELAAGDMSPVLRGFVEGFRQRVRPTQGE
jgi:indolepyruvate decarboxylase